MKYYKKQRFFLLIIWTILIFILLTAPMPVSEDDKISFLDKIVHFLLFGSFSFLLSHFLVALKNKLKLTEIMLIGFLVSLSYAGLLELIQSYIPSRTRSIFDLLFGILGIVSSVILFYEIHRKK